MTLNEHLRPIRTGLAAVLRFAWDITFGALRDFVWADIRGGMIDLRHFSRATRVIILLGFALIFGLAGLLLFGDVWRAQSPLISLPTALNMTGRGRLVPLVLAPVTYALLALAWAFALNGLLHSHWLARVGMLALYVLAGLQRIAALFPEVAYGVTPPAELILRGGLLLCVPAFYLVRWRRPARPALEFAILLVLAAAPLAITQWSDFAYWRLSGDPTLFINLEADLLNFRLLIGPLLLLIGIDIANFARQLSGWTTNALHERLLTWQARLPILSLLLIGLLIWRLGAVIVSLRERIAAAAPKSELAAYAGALGVVLLCAVWAWLVNRGHGVEEELLAQTTERHAPPLVLAYLVPQMLAFALLLIASAFPYAGFAHDLIVSSNAVNDQATSGWRLLICVAALASGIWLRLRFAGRPTSQALALYLGTFGLLGLWMNVTAPGNLLQSLFWQGAQPLDFWWTLLVSATAFYWLARRRLDAERAAKLLFALLIVILLQQTSFLENPFSPLFGFAGIGFLVFGICWDALTGGSWVNNDSAALPRAGRIFLYLGYTLLTVTVITWALGTHDLESLNTLTGGAADAGFGNFGRPLLYATIIVTLMSTSRTPAEGQVGNQTPDLSSGTSNR
jgi:hypothetical protein